MNEKEHSKGKKLAKNISTKKESKKIQKSFLLLFLILKNFFLNWETMKESFFEKKFSSTGATNSLISLLLNTSKWWKKVFKMKNKVEETMGVIY